jgi:hypothetical protein
MTTQPQPDTWIIARPTAATAPLAHPNSVKKALGTLTIGICFSVIDDQTGMICIGFVCAYLELSVLLGLLFAVALSGRARCFLFL